MKSLVFSKPRKTITTIAVAVILSTSLIGCAHEIATAKSPPPVTPITFSPDANLVEELTVQNRMMDKSYMDQVDVLAPIHFEAAKNLLTRANQENKKGASTKEIFKTLSYARAHLMEANQEALLTQTKVSEITHARKQALDAGARKYPNELTAIDNQFKKFLASTTPEKRIPLQNDYLALELRSIKDTKLGKSQALIKEAKFKKADTITPQAYNETIQKFNIAEKVIEIDRHSNKKIDAAIASTNVAANHMMKLLDLEQKSCSQTPEERAMTLESRNNALKQADSAITEVALVAIQKNNELKIKNANLALAENENKEHERKEHDDKLLTDSAALFDKAEADVYRQDGLLIIRLKSMNFASGRSDLPADSLAVLNKVKEVIKNTGPGNITIQGHTDDVGAAVTNQKLSQSRAKSVMRYFATDKILDENSFDSIGYGYTKPLATNKTKEGRSQNRRVDIVIKPNQTI